MHFGDKWVVRNQIRHEGVSRDVKLDNLFNRVFGSVIDCIFHLLKQEWFQGHIALISLCLYRHFIAFEFIVSEFFHQSDSLVRVPPTEITGEWRSKEEFLEIFGRNGFHLCSNYE